LPWSLLNLHLLLPGFALVLFRVAGLTLTAPMLSSQAIPARFRIGFALTTAAVMFPLVSPTIPADISLTTALVGVVGEMTIGLVIGLSVTLVLIGVQVAGMLIGQQAGIALASVVDPSQGTESTVVGQIYVIVTTLIFLGIGGHRMMIAALLDTFAVVPVLGFSFDPSMMDMIGDLLSAAFILAVKLFAPVLIALLLASIVLGFLGRTIPQLNILSVGFAVRSLAALTVAALALAASQDVLVEALINCLQSIRTAFGLGPLSV